MLERFFEGNVKVFRCVWVGYDFFGLYGYIKVILCNVFFIENVVWLCNNFVILLWDSEIYVNVK